MNKRSSVFNRYHLLANERSAVATHEQVSQFTVVFWRLFCLEKKQIFLFTFWVLPI